MEYYLNFPKSVEEFRKFASDRILSVEKIDDQLCSSIIQKIDSGIYEFTEQEISMMRNVIDISHIGVICDCDDDHRIGEDGKSCTFSYYKNGRR